MQQRVLSFPEFQPNLPAEVSDSGGRGGWLWAKGATWSPLPLTNPLTRIGRGDQTVGYCPDLDLSGDDAVSRHHLEIWHAADRFAVMECGSTNGTLVNDEPLAPDQLRLLRDGDRICLGRQTTLIICLGPQLAPAPLVPPTAATVAMPELPLARPELSRLAAYREEHPSPTLSLMFTELIVQADPGAAPGELAARQRRDHERLVREVVEGAGDGCFLAAFDACIFCAFGELGVGLARARQLQEKVERHNAGKPEAERLRTRAGLASGAVGAAPEPDPVAAARIAYRAGQAVDQARPGQVLVSSTTGPVRDVDAADPSTHRPQRAAAGDPAGPEPVAGPRRRRWRVLLGVRRSPEPVAPIPGPPGRVGPGASPLSEELL